MNNRTVSKQRAGSRGRVGMDDKFSDERAQVIRRDWFLFLDEVEPFHSMLYSYCLKLTGSVWDAEDLLQDVLLKGYGMVARGDFHGEHSPISNLKAYLFRTTTNHWLDLQRRGRWMLPHWDEEQLVEAQGVDIRYVSAAMEKALTVSSPQEFASILLKEVYGFSLLEIAEFIGTSEGTVKSALNRVRAKVAKDASATSENGARAAYSPVDPQVRVLAEAFVDAMNSGEVSELKALMAKFVQITVCNVGGGRGRDGIWTEKSAPGIVAEYGEYQGQGFVALYRMDTGEFHNVVTLQGAEGVVTRIMDYSYAKDTLERIAAELGILAPRRGYHQPWDTIKNMVATTALPWFKKSP